MGRHQDHPFWHLKKASLRELSNLLKATQMFTGKARHWTKVCLIFVHCPEFRRLSTWGGLRARTYRVRKLEDNVVHTEIRGDGNGIETISNLRLMPQLRSQDRLPMWDGWWGALEVVCPLLSRKEFPENSHMPHPSGESQGAWGGWLCHGHSPHM